MTLSQMNLDEYSKEIDLSARLTSEINAFWQEGIFSSFNGIEQIRVNYATFIHDEVQESIVLVTGRTESYLKYQELAFDLYHQGYNVFIIDHRGQGLSQRLLKNKQKGYVTNFDDYAHDLKQLIDEVVVSNSTDRLLPKPHLLAHSMGGAIAVRMMQLYPTLVKSAVLTSPMIAVNNGNIPNWLGKAIINIGDKLNAWFSDEANYFMGQTGFKNVTFADNELCQSEVRYQIFVDIYNKNKAIQLGGVTTHWLKEAIIANSNIFANLDKLITPILVMQSGSDTIVSNEAQNAFCQQLHKKNSTYCPEDKPFTINNALHELMFEKDQYRSPAIKKALDWFSTYSA